MLEYAPVTTLPPSGPGAEHAAVAARAPESIRGSAFGLLAALQSAGNLAASAIAGILWTVSSPTVAFLWLAAWMLTAAIVFLTMPRDGTRTPAPVEG